MPGFLFSTIRSVARPLSLAACVWLACGGEYAAAQAYLGQAAPNDGRGAYIRQVPADARPAPAAPPPRAVRPQAGAIQRAQRGAALQPANPTQFVIARSGAAVSNTVSRTAELTVAGGSASPAATASADSATGRSADPRQQFPSVGTGVSMVIGSSSLDRELPSVGVGVANVKR